MTMLMLFFILFSIEKHRGCIFPKLGSHTYHVDTVLKVGVSIDAEVHIVEVTM